MQKRKNKSGSTSLAKSKLVTHRVLSQNIPLIAVVLFVVTALVYLPSLSYGFIDFDDPSYVSDNPHVQGGLTLAGLKWAFRTYTGANWHPLTWLSLMTDVQFFGHSAGAEHLTNALLHAANAALLFIVMGRLTGAVGRSLFMAALFALHPLHVESVAWVSERKDVLSGFFGLLTLLVYEVYVRTPVQNPKRKVFYALAILFFALGLLSKPMLVTLPFVMLLLDYWPLERFKAESFALNKLIFEKIPFFILSLLFSIITMTAQTKGDSVKSLSEFPFAVRVENAFVSYARQLGHTFWPKNLALMYPYPGHWPLGIAAASALLVLVLCGLALWWRAKFPFLFTGWFWFFGQMIPVIGLVQTGDQSMADRHTYLPSIGLFIVFSWGAWALVRRWQIPNKLFGATAALILIACTFQTHHQLGYWKDSETLFRHSFEVTQNNDWAACKVAVCLDTRGQLDEAAYYYRKAIEFNPLSFDAENNLASILDRTGNTVEAIEHYRAAFRLAPDNADVCNNLGTVIAKTGALDEAAPYFIKAVQLEPTNAKAYCNLGNIMFVKGKNDDAIDFYSKAITLNPQFIEAYLNLGNIFVKQSRTEQAVECYKKVLQLDPHNGKAIEQLNALGVQP